MPTNKSKTKYYSEHEISTVDNDLILKNNDKETVITSQKNSSSPDDGSLNTKGGAGIKKDLHLGGNANIGGELDLTGDLKARNIYTENIYQHEDASSISVEAFALNLTGDSNLSLNTSSGSAHAAWLATGKQFLFMDHAYGNPNPPGPPFIGNPYDDIPFQFYGDTGRAALKLSNKHEYGDGIYFLHGGLGSTTRDVNYLSTYYMTQSMEWDDKEKTFSVYMPSDKVTENNGSLSDYTITIRSFDDLQIMAKNNIDFSASGTVDFTGTKVKGILESGVAAGNYYTEEDSFDSTFRNH